jgi:hypothetical protein
MIEVVCTCKWRFEVQDEHAGLSLKCPKCRRLVAVPAAPPVPIAGADAPPSPVDDPTGPGRLPPDDRPSRVGLATSAEVEALRASIERLVVVSRSINTRLAWIVALLVLLLIRVLLRR